MVRWLNCFSISLSLNFQTTYKLIPLKRRVDTNYWVVTITLAYTSRWHEGECTLWIEHLQASCKVNRDTANFLTFILRFILPVWHVNSLLCSELSLLQTENRFFKSLPLKTLQTNKWCIATESFLIPTKSQNKGLFYCKCFARRKHSFLFWITGRQLNQHVFT